MAYGEAITYPISAMTLTEDVEHTTNDNRNSEFQE